MSSSTSSSKTHANDLGEAEKSSRKEQRRAAHREAKPRYRQARAVGETTAQRQQRLKKNKEWANKRRASEKSESRALRLDKERSRRRLSRSKESSDQKQSRLASIREAAKNRTQLESETDKID